MTTASYSTPWDNSTDAAFRAWGSALSAAMQSCGLQQSADTGQIDWSTVTVPTTNDTSGGYEIYQFTDGLQATSPVFIKIEYGAGINQTGIEYGGYGYPQMWITVGPSTDGAGNMTGVTTNRVLLLPDYNESGGIPSNTTPYPTYVCFDGSYIGVVHKIGGLNTYNGAGFGGGGFMIGRQCNPASGEYIGGGVTCLTSVQYSSPTYVWEAQSLNMATNMLYTSSNGYFSLIPYTMTSTSIASLGEYQIFPCYGVYNQAVPLAWCAYGLNAETAQGTSIDATIVGTTAQTYLMTGAASQGAAQPSNANYSLLMKYQ